jgi:hypothetical protein
MLKKGVPYWPQSNGKVERCNKTILKVVRIANLLGKSGEVNSRTSSSSIVPHPTQQLAYHQQELLVGRKLRDKLPKVHIPKDRATEAQWQQLLRERDALRKLKQREYADNRRSAEYSEIAEGDEVLLKKTRENKLSPNFEPEPYTMIQKDGNAVIIEDSQGKTMMRNTAHLKKPLRPDLPSTPQQDAIPKGVDSDAAPLQTPPAPVPPDSR